MMDKKKLNNEIVLCRSAVRKAKVAVIRKLLKKMKILKTCKVDGVKEKKLKKSERIFKKVQIMKRIKEDEVTKFALRHVDIEAILKMPKPKLRQNALALLAKHEAVSKKIGVIREQILNWETELPLLLDSLGKKKKQAVSKQETGKDRPKLTPPIAAKDALEGQLKKKGSVMEKTVRQSVKPKQSAKAPSKTVKADEKNVEEVEKVEKIQRIEDPFFIGKEIVAPKLVLESWSNQKNKHEKLELPLLERENSKSAFHTKPFKPKRNSKEFKTQKPSCGKMEEKLHPSWAAKKVTLIKPFQGKKITFLDE